MIKINKEEFKKTNHCFRESSFFTYKCIKCKLTVFEIYNNVFINNSGYQKNIPKSCEEYIMDQALE